MHSLAYSIEGLMATMIAELLCVISLLDEPNAESARLAMLMVELGAEHISAGSAPVVPVGFHCFPGFTLNRLAQRRHGWHPPRQRQPFV
jgi:hypothetical protein